MKLPYLLAASAAFLLLYPTQSAKGFELNDRIRIAAPLSPNTDAYGELSANGFLSGQFHPPVWQVQPKVTVEFLWDYDLSEKQYGSLETPGTPVQFYHFEIRELPRDDAPLIHEHKSIPRWINRIGVEAMKAGGGWQFARVRAYTVGYGSGATAYPTVLADSGWKCFYAYDPAAWANKTFPQPEKNVDKILLVGALEVDGGFGRNFEPYQFYFDQVMSDWSTNWMSPTPTNLAIVHMVFAENEIGLTWGGDPYEYWRHLGTVSSWGHYCQMGHFLSDRFGYWFGPANYTFVVKGIINPPNGWVQGL